MFLNNNNIMYINMYKIYYIRGFVSYCEMELFVFISVYINIKVFLSRFILGNGCLMYRDIKVIRKI